MRSAVDAVLFDLDDTLADRDRAFLAWARWFAQERLGPARQEAIDEAVAALVALDAGGRTPKDVLFSTLKDRYPRLAEDATDLAAAFREQLLGHLPPLEDGAARLLDALDARGIPWGIVTNGSAGQLRKIEKLGLAGRSACVVVSEVVGVRKPDPAIFRAAAASIGVAPARTMFVGDHPEADVVGAAGAGMRTAWLRRGRAWPAHLAAPDVTVDALDALLWLGTDARAGGSVVGGEGFWQLADELVAASQVVVDRPRGSPHPRYPDVAYPLDYGYLAQTRGGDGGGIDVWVGSLGERHVTGAIVAVDLAKRDAEVKLLLGCTADEAGQAHAHHQRGRQGCLLLRRAEGW